MSTKWGVARSDIPYMVERGGVLWSPGIGTAQDLSCAGSSYDGPLIRIIEDEESL